jgi:hypothetical protein
MSRSIGSVLLAGLLAACSSGGQGTGGVDMTTDDQPNLSSEQPSSGSEAPPLSTEQPSGNPESPTVSCEPASSKELMGTVEDIACAQAVVCGQPTNIEYWQSEQRYLSVDEALWGYLCAFLGYCREHPAECEQDGDLPPGTTGELCADQVAACYRAAIGVLGCVPSEAANAALDANPPAACAGIIEPSEPAPPSYPYDQNPYPAP